MKIILAVLTLCCLSACVTKPPTLPSRAVNVPPHFTREFRLAFAYPPYSIDAPQIHKIPRSAEAPLVRVRDGLLAAVTEIQQPEKLPVAYLYELQSAEAGAWQSLGLVDGLGRFVKTVKREHGWEVVPRFTDENATRILRDQIEEMALERADTQPVPHPHHSAMPPEGTPIEGRAGFLRSPFDLQGRPIDVRGLPKGTEVEDPYNPGKTLLVP